MKTGIPMSSTPEKVDPNFKHELEWLKLRSHWTPESQLLVIHDFLKAKGLFKDLTEFAKGRKRW